MVEKGSQTPEPEDQSKFTGRVDAHRAARQLERFMRGVNPYFDINAPGDERMTSEERQDEIAHRKHYPTDTTGWKVLAEITDRFAPDGTFIHQDRRSDPEDSEYTMETTNTTLPNGTSSQVTRRIHARFIPSEDQPEPQT